MHDAVPTGFLHILHTCDILTRQFGVAEAPLLRNG
jgi:hypothetical protein